MKVIDMLTKMTRLVACTQTTGTKKLANLVLKHMWTLQKTPKTIVSNHRNVCISQVAKEPK